MNGNFKKSALGMALALSAGFGAVQQANADVYARSYVEIDNLQLGIVSAADPTNPVPAGTVDIISYVNTIGGIAQLNGSVSVEAGQCTLATCPTTSPTLDGFAGVEYAWVGVDPGSQNFSFLGPGSDQYARADSVVWDSAIVQIANGADPATAVTHVEQIAEAELQANGSGGASTAISSTTGFEVTFSVADGVGPFFFELAFTAVWDQLVQILPNVTGSGATSDLSASMTLRNNTTNELLSWNPGASCTSTFAGGCASVDTAGLLNDVISVSDGGQSASNMGSGAFGVISGPLAAGTYTLGLSLQSLVEVHRAVPAPATLGIFGLGLTLLGGVLRRRRLS